MGLQFYSYKGPLGVGAVGSLCLPRCSLWCMVVFLRPGPSCLYISGPLTVLRVPSLPMGGTRERGPLGLPCLLRGGLGRGPSMTHLPRGAVSLGWAPSTVVVRPLPCASVPEVPFGRVAEPSLSCRPWGPAHPWHCARGESVTFALTEVSPGLVLWCSSEALLGPSPGRWDQAAPTTV